MMSSTTVLQRHGVTIELTDFLEDVNTVNDFEITGECAMFDVEDLDAVPRDIRNLMRRAEKIKEIERKTGYPWIAREVLDGRAYIIEGRLTYTPSARPKTIRESMERIVGGLTDAQFKEICDIVTDDVKANLRAFGKNTDIDMIIKIAAITLETLRKCST